MRRSCCVDPWNREAAEGGELDAWYHIGKAYETGKIVSADPVYAARCYEKGLTQRADTGKKVGCANLLGAMYFNGQYIPQDYNRAFQLLKYGYEHNSTWGVCYLGKCYFYGWGTPQDFVRAREFLEKVDWNNHDAFYMLGVIYGQGLGVAGNIPKAVEYLQRAKSNAEARKELRRYKKTLFSKWVRR